MSDEQATPAAEPAQSGQRMHIDRYERRWVILAVATLVIFTIAVTIAGFALGIQVPTTEGRVDPETLATTPPWSEPGLREVVPGEEYDLYMIGQRFFFVPNEVTIPVGAKLNIYATSSDVQHGIKVQDTNINMMVIPGQVSKLSATFEEAGTYDYICHEYCGLGHAVMWGRIIVEPPAAEGGA